MTAQPFSRTQRLTLTAMLIAVGILLPFATSHAFALPGNVLLPMHIPVLLCGLLCGPLCGAVSGAVLPLLNSVLTGMPPLYPMLPIMTGELLVYGLVSGALLHHTPLRRFRFGVYPALLLAMISGRATYGLIFRILLLVNGECKALSVWGALVTGLPGIVIQLLLIPGIVWTVGYGYQRGEQSAVRSAINLIDAGTVACAVIRDRTIVRTEYGRGIGPALSLLDEGMLKDTVVVDKIVGKAAAILLTAGGVRRVYALTASQSAVDWFHRHGVEIGFRECVPTIINRQGTGICPMEETVLNLDDPDEAIAALRKKREELSHTTSPS